MKFLKSLFILSFFTFAIISCTPESIEEELNGSEQSSYDTGGEAETGNNGSKE